MYRRDAHNLVCIFFISMLAVVFVAAPAALGDWLPNPTASVDTAEVAEQAIQEDSSFNTLDLDTGFRPEVDGFSFENYGDEISPVDLTNVEMQRLFGKSVCSGDDECTLIPNARRWMEENNKEMTGGHCEGMAVLSLLFYLGIEDPEKFGGATTHDLELEGNEPLQREIAYWWATQSTSPEEDFVQGPNEVLKTLEKTFQAGENASDTWTVGVAREDGSGDHAVTPFAVQDVGNGIYEIPVYDNNYPDETKVISVDSNDNTFTYETATNPEEESNLYAGHNLTLSGTNGRLMQQKCDFCQDDNSTDDDTSEKTAKPGKNRYVQVWHDGRAGMLIKDDQGRRLGKLGNGTLINEIPGAKVHGFRINKTKTLPKAAEGNRSEYLYLLPSEINYSVSLDGASLNKTEKQEITSIGPGYYTEVEGLALSPGSQGQVGFSSPKKSYEEVSYQFDGNASPKLKAGINTKNGPSYEFLVMENNTNITANRVPGVSGETTRMGIDRTTNRLKVVSDGREIKDLYDLNVVRLSSRGPEVFSHRSIAIGVGAAMIIDYSLWEGEGHAMPIGIDENDDGTVDEIFDLTDDGGSYGEVTSEDNQMAEAEVGEEGASQDHEIANANGELMNTNELMETNAELTDTNVDAEIGMEPVFDGGSDAGGDAGSE